MGVHCIISLVLHIFEHFSLKRVEKEREREKTKQNQKPGSEKLSNAESADRSIKRVDLTLQRALVGVTRAVSVETEPVGRGFKREHKEGPLGGSAS